jgi:hypothetical protein
MAKQLWEKSIVSPWSNKFFQRPYDLLITSDEVVLDLGGKPIAAAVRTPPAAGETTHTSLGRTLKTVLDQAPGLKGRSANVWLSDGLVTQSVVEMDVRAMREADVSAALKSYWQDTLDVPAATLAVTYQVQSCGRTIFSSCCDVTLINAIESTVSLSGWTTKKIAPHLARVWNEGRQQIRTKDCFLLLLQDKVLSIGVHQKGRWVAWSSEGCENADWQELLGRTTRFCRSTGLGDPKSLPVWIYAPQSKGSPRSAGLSNWSLLKTSPDAGLNAGRI